VSAQTWISAMLLVRTLLYLMAAYGLFVLATYFPVHETRSHRLTRQSCYALSIFFILAGYKTVVLFAHIDTVIADTVLTPALLLVVIMIYAGVIYLSRDRGHNGALATEHVGKGIQ